MSAAPLSELELAELELFNAALRVKRILARAEASDPRLIALARAIAGNAKSVRAVIDHGTASAPVVTLSPRRPR